MISTLTSPFFGPGIMRPSFWAEMVTMGAFVVGAPVQQKRKGQNVMPFNSSGDGVAPFFPRTPYLLLLDGMGGRAI